MTTQGSPTSRPISGSYAHGSLKPLGCSGRLSCSFDNDGIPHFHDLYEGSPGARKRSNTVLSQCSDDTSVSMKDEFALPKSTAEKLLREAEEESEKVTLGLLHRLEQLNKEKSQLSRRIEEESDQVVDRLIKSQRAAFGSSFGGSKWLGPEQLPVSPTTPASHTHHRPVSRSTVSLCALDENVVVRDMIDHQHQHQQPCASKVPPATATTPLSSRRLPISLESLRLSDLMIDADPNVVVDRLKDALAEAEAVRDQAARADKWAQETWTMANKFRNEVIELRTKLGFATDGVMVLPPPPTSSFSPDAHRRRSSTITSAHPAAFAIERSVPLRSATVSHSPTLSQASAQAHPSLDRATNLHTTHSTSSSLPNDAITNTKSLARITSLLTQLHGGALRDSSAVEGVPASTSSLFARRISSHPSSPAALSGEMGSSTFVSTGSLDLATSLGSKLASRSRASSRASPPPLTMHNVHFDFGQSDGQLHPNKSEDEKARSTGAKSASPLPVDESPAPKPDAEASASATEGKAEAPQEEAPGEAEEV